MLELIILISGGILSLNFSASFNASSRDLQTFDAEFLGFSL